MNSFANKLLIFLALFGVLYFFNLGGYGLLDVDEPRYAEASREMIESGNWITPYFNYEVRYDKPIFFYWLQAISMSVFGVNEIAARLPSVLMSFFCVFFIFIFLNRFYSVAVSLLGSLILMSSLEFAALSRFSIPDMTLSAFITSSIVSFYIGYDEVQKSARFFKDQIKTFSFWYILGFLFMALGFLTKGPVVLIINFLIFVPFFWWIRKLDYFYKNISFWVGFLVFFIVALPWYIAVHIATKGAFTEVFFGLHNITRYTSVVSGHKGQIYYFVPVILIGFIPWTFFLIQAISCVIKKGLKSILSSPKNQFQWFALWWFLAIFIFFSFSKTKLLTYILSVFPALSLLVAIWFDGILSKKNSYQGLTVGLTVFFVFCLVALYLSVFQLDVIFPSDIKGIKINLYVTMFVILLLVGISMAWSSSNKDTQMTFMFILGTFLILYFCSVTFLLPKIDSYSQSKLRAFSKYVPAEAELVTFKLLKPSIIFYAKRRVEKIDKLKQLKKRINMGGKFAFVARKKDLQEVKLRNVYKWGEDHRFVYYTNYRIED